MQHIKLTKIIIKQDSYVKIPNRQSIFISELYTVCLH